MQQVKAWLEQAVKGCNIRLIDEPVLFKTGLSASTLPNMEHDVAATPVQRKVWQEKMREREANLKARGYCHDALSFLPHCGPRSHQPLYV